MRIITIDNGNTNPHVGIFENNQLLKVIPLIEFSKNSSDFILISSVGEKISLSPNINLIHYYNKNNFFNMPVNYSMTLGIDRLLTSYFVFKNNFKLDKSDKILIIDAGTFITIDLVSIQGFEGGYIFPGIKKFLNIYQSGAQLPNLDLNHFLNEKNNIPSTPNNTNDAIIGATHFFIESILENILRIIKPNKIIITGGTGELILNKLVSLTKIQTEIHPHLIHYSIHQIYQEHFHLRS